MISLDVSLIYQRVNQLRISLLKTCQKFLHETMNHDLIFALDYDKEISPTINEKFVDVEGSLIGEEGRWGIDVDHVTGRQ